ncbi:hypothetical protein RQP46_010665 [Phenoliferia psychrophenolica]
MNTAANIIDKHMPTPEGVPTSHNANPSNNPQEFADPSGAKMQALVWEAKGKPRIVDPNDVVLKVTGSTICVMGIVESCGPEVTKIKPGDRVVASFTVACGKCCSLQNAMYGNRLSGIFGYSHFTGGFAGGQAEFVRVPWGDANLLKIPDGVPDEQALYLSDVLVTSYNCVVDTGVKKGDIVGVWGAGPIGILTAKWAFLKGASRVILIDNLAWRLEHAAKKIPGLEVLNFSVFKDVPKRINELTASDPNSFEDARPPGLDVALDCAGGEYAKSLINKAEMAVGLETDTSEIANECIESVRNYGSVGVTAEYSGFSNHFNIGAVMEKGVRFIGNGQAPVHLHWETVLNDYVVPKKIDVVDLIVTHRIPIEKLAEYYYKHDQREEGLIKTFVETRFSSPPSAGAPKLSTE